MLLQLFKGSKGQRGKKDPFTNCINESEECMPVVAMKYRLDATCSVQGLVLHNPLLWIATSTIGRL